MDTPAGEDEDFRRAIALSLGTSTAPEGTADASSSNDEDGDLRRAIAMSLADTTPQRLSETDGTEPPRPWSRKSGAADAESQPATNQATFLGLDRAAMEQERLARLAARGKASTGTGPCPPSKPIQSSGTPVGGSVDPATGQDHSHLQNTFPKVVNKTLTRPISPPPRKRQKIAPTTDTPFLARSLAPAAGHQQSVKPTPRLHHERRLSSTYQPAESKPPVATAGLQYPHGTVKKTWAYGHPRQNDIKIDEVLQKDDLNIAVLSAFQWDFDWLLQKLNLQRTRLLFIMHAKDKSHRDLLTKDFEGISSVRLRFPPMPGQVNCMHSKLMLLFYANNLRVVVPSANLVKYDWGETGVMENVVRHLASHLSISQRQKIDHRLSFSILRPRTLQSTVRFWK